VRSIALGRVDGQPVYESPYADRLRTAGFVDGYRGLTLRS
jgi:hypothetical protein